MLHFQARWKQKKTEKCKLDLSPLISIFVSLFAFFPTSTSTLRHGGVYFVLQLQNEFIVFIFVLVFPYLHHLLSENTQPCSFLSAKTSGVSKVQYATTVLNH